MKNEIFEDFLVEGFEINEASVVEGKSTLPNGVLSAVKGPSFFLDGYSRNGRFYPKKLWENALKEPQFETKLSKGLVFGCIGHPKDYTLDELLESGKVSHKLVNVDIDEKKGVGVCEYHILDTPSGRILNTILQSGSDMYVSTRAFGSFTNETKEKDGSSFKILDEKNFAIEAIDFVIEPGFLQANPKLLESIEEDLMELAEDPAHIQCENGICSLGEDMKTIHREQNLITEKIESDLNNLDKEVLIEMINNIVEENKRLSEEVSSEQEDEKSSEDEFQISAKLYNNYVSYIELLTKMVKFNVDYEKYYDDLIEFLDKDDKLTTSDIEDLEKIVDEILSNDEINESIIDICNKIKALTAKINNKEEKDEKEDKDDYSQGGDEETSEEFNFVDYIFNTINRIDDSNNTLVEKIDDQLETIGLLKSEVNILQMGSDALVDMVGSNESVEKIVEVPVEKIVEKIIEVPVEKIVEKIVEVETYPEGYDDLYVKMEDSYNSIKETHDATIIKLTSVDEELTVVKDELITSENKLTKITNEYQTLDDKNKKTSVRMMEYYIGYLSTVHRVEKSIVKNFVEKYDTEDKLLEALKRESKVNRIAKRPIDELPVYNPLQSEKSKKLERLM